MFEFLVVSASGVAFMVTDQFIIGFVLTLIGAIYVLALNSPRDRIWV